MPSLLTDSNPFAPSQKTAIEGTNHAFPKLRTDRKRRHNWNFKKFPARRFSMNPHGQNRIPPHGPVNNHNAPAGRKREARSRSLTSFVHPRPECRRNQAHHSLSVKSNHKHIYSHNDNSIYFSIIENLRRCQNYGRIYPTARRSEKLPKTASHIKPTIFSPPMHRFRKISKYSN